MDHPTDPHIHLAALLAATGSGSEAAFRALYCLTRRYLYGVALRVLRSPAEAEEALQEAFLRVWRHAGAYRPELGAPMTWLITIVRREALTMLRARRCEEHCLSRAYPPDDYDEHDDAGAPAAADSDLTRMLAAALARLDAPQRQSIALAYGKGLTHAELSAHLNVPPGTVKTWLRRGIGRLQRLLVGRVPPPSAACYTALALSFVVSP